MAEEEQSSNEVEHPDPRAEFAPRDYTDGREPGEWRTDYPVEARKEMNWEAIYVFAVFLLYSGLVFVLLFLSSDGSSIAPNPTDNDANGEATPNDASRWLPAPFLGYCCAWAAGGVGGSVFGLKWMYHCVAKRIWHQDRRLWRIITPHISAALATFMILVVSSGLINIFDKDISVRHVDVLALSFLVGYFSDKALAKFAEVADTLFGSGKADSDAQAKKQQTRDNQA